ncbi:hypothetical protein CsSME_00003129 [Camellia sinensis var. sinensis]
MPPSPIMQLGVKPKPPINPAQRPLIMSPYRLGITRRSKRAGFFTSIIQQLSITTSSYVMSGYFSATSRQHLRKRPSVFCMMLALWIADSLSLSRFWGVALYPNQ